MMPRAKTSAQIRWAQIRWAHGFQITGWKFHFPHVIDPPQRDPWGILHIQEGPVAGPVALHVVEPKPRQGRPIIYYAQCLMCGECSKRYKKKHWGLLNWAHDHRCKRGTKG